MMFRSKDVGGMDESWVVHLMERLYLQGVQSGVWEKVMQIVSGNVLWSEREQESLYQL